MHIQEIQMWQKIQPQEIRLTSQNENRVNFQPEAIKNWIVNSVDAGKRLIENANLFHAPVTEPAVCVCDCQS